jgi:hypothetical protein
MLQILLANALLSHDSHLGGFVRRDFLMFYKIKIAVATASIMAFGILPASAVIPQFGDASTTAPSLYKQDASHYVTSCKWVRIQTDYGYKKVKRCKKVYPKHYNSY